MSGGTTNLVAAFIGSAPGWVGVALAVKANRRALDRQTAQLQQATAAQTNELKAHVADVAARGPSVRDGGAT